MDSENYLNLQNKARIALVTEKYQEAIEKYEQCIELNSEDINNYIGLGLVYLLQGQGELAEFTWMSLLLENEDINKYQEITSNILKKLDQQASIFLNLENKINDKKAQIIYQKLLEIDSSFIDAYLGLGILSMREEKYQQVIEYFRYFLEKETNFARIYYLQGICYQKLNNINKAIENFEIAVQLNYGDFDCWYQLIECLLIQGNIKKAWSLATDCKNRFSSKSIGYNLCGDCLQYEGKFLESLSNYYQGFLLDLSYISNQKMISLLEDEKAQNIVFTKEEKELIFKVLNDALRFNNKKLMSVCVNILFNDVKYNNFCYESLIELALLENNIEKVINICLEAKQKYPEQLTFSYSLAYWLENQHRLEEAEKVVNEYLYIDPENLRMKFLRQKILYRKGDKTVLPNLILLGQQPDVSLDDKAVKGLIFNEIAYLYDQEKQYQKAFEYYIKSKETRLQEYQEQEEYRLQAIKSFEFQIETCTNNYFANWKDYDLVNEYFNSYAHRAEKNPNLVFLVGFPRSGTTLLGKILDSHDNIECLDEKDGITVLETFIISTLFRQDSNSSERHVNIYFYPEMLKNLKNWDLNLINTFRKVYFSTMNNYLVDHKVKDLKILVDKNPFCLTEVPLIHRIFPEAKIICLIRHPLDVCLSSFSQFFTLYYNTANFSSLENTAKFYDLVMNNWLQSTSVLPVKNLMIFYEDLVADPDKIMKQVLNFLELSWQDQILDYHKNSSSKKVISTPSYRQINQPIYEKAKYRWLNYQNELKPIMPILEPWLKRFNYPI